jgi:hypothetical protein
MSELHFTVGTNIGEILYDIATEKLLQKANYQGCIDTYLKSFRGIELEMVKRILLGELAVVGNNDCTVSIGKYSPEEFPDFTPIDFKNWITEKVNKLKETSQSGSLQVAWNNLEICRNDSVTVEVEKDNFEKICLLCGYDCKLPNLNIEIGAYVRFTPMKLLAALTSLETPEFLFTDALLDYCDDEKFRRLYYQMKFLLGYRLDCIHYYKVNEILLQELGVDAGVKPWLENQMVDWKIKFDYYISSDFSERDQVKDSIKAFIAAELDYAKMGAIEPVNIKDKYDAGWINPDGLVFAMNGEISNMLHCKIADKIAEKYDMKFTYASESDRWLEKEGWVKFHNGWVLFEGRWDERHPATWKKLTDAQVNVIADYIDTCEEGCIFGFRRIPVTRNMWINMEPLMREQLFMY